MYKKLTSEDFITSSIIRFGSHKNYIQEKILVDFFAIKGNMKIAECLRKYIQKHLPELKALSKIRLVDIGPAIGALTTLFALQELDRFGLMDKTRIYLVDVSERVLDKTQEGDFFFPKSLIDPSLKKVMLKKLKNSKCHASSAVKLPFKDNHFDMVLAGFLFHNLHDDLKNPVADQLQRIVKKDGFIGVAEEWFENYKKEYALEHANDEVPLAYEAPIAMEKLVKYFDSMQITECSKSKDIPKENYYYFCGEGKK